MALIFENEVCGRCGGTGEYSYNQIDGSRCFGCNGKKVRLTKRGVAAQSYFKELCTKPIAEIAIGDLVYGLNQSAGYVVDFNLALNVNGQVFYNLSHKGSICGNYVGPDYVLRIKPVGAERDAAIAKALAYQNSLTKTGQIEKYA